MPKLNSKEAVPFRLLLPYVLSLAAGVVALTAPDVLGIDGLNPFLFFTFGASFAVGLLMAIAWPRSWWLWPNLFVLGYPVTVVIDIYFDPKSHNLWPLEMAFCIPYVITGLLGAAISRFLLNPHAGSNG